MRDTELPDGWSMVRMEQCCDPEAPICYGILMPGEHVPGGVPVIKVKDLEHHKLRRESLLHTSPEIDAQYSRSRVRPRDVLLSIRGSTGVVEIVPGDLDGANITQDTARIRPNGVVSTEFLAQSLQSAEVQRQIRLHTVGQAVKGINIAEVRRLKLGLPPIPQQQAIVRVLGAVDRRLRCVERLTVARRKLKRGLLQQLLTGQRRFPEFRKQPWRECRLRDVAEECNEPGRGTLGRDRIMGVMKSRGIVPMEDRLIGNVDRYQIVRKDWFAYNPMRLNIGSIARSHSTEPVLVSPDYVVFRCRNGELDPAFLDQYRKGHSWDSFMRVCGAGSVRVRIYFKELGRLKISLPRIEEQRRIAAVLDTLDLELAQLRALHDSLKDQKKGLMQKLLTGQVRVPASMLKEASHA